MITLQLCWKLKQKGADMLSLIEHGFFRLLSLIFDKPLPAPTSCEMALAKNLKDSLARLSFIQAKDNVPPSEATWISFTERLRRLVSIADPREFLRWDVVKETMFVTSRYIKKELNYLKKRPDWNSRWRRAIIESPIGHPRPYPLYPSSSGNLIHHAYHLACFEEKTGTRADRGKFIFEFGGGYGSMCRLFHNLGFKGRYVIFDLPAFSALQRFFLQSSGIPVHSLDVFRSGNKGAICVSDLEELKILLSDCAQDDSSMFIATWSISETPVHLRDSVLPLITRFGAFLIGYRNVFCEVDNYDFFMKWKENCGSQVDWHNWQIEHLQGEYYLVGKRLGIDAVFA